MIKVRKSDCRLVSGFADFFSAYCDIALSVSETWPLFGSAVHLGSEYIFVFFYVFAAKHI